jgi:CheY-like chemotaxis protein
MSSEYRLVNFITDTANVNLANLGSRSVILNIVPDENLPAKLIGDTLRVRQVFSSLLTYAFHQTKAGGVVEWRISAEKEGDTAWLVSSVSDTSDGIKPKDIDKVFLDYSSLDTQKTTASKGTGLGLALAKKIVDLMKGTITVESTPGKGSVFTVRLLHKYVSNEILNEADVEKLKKIKHAGQKSFDKSSLQRVQFSGARVLVVDDVDINLEVAQAMLEPYGLAVDCVISGQEAIELVRNGDPRYDLILMNRWMQEMDGMEAVRVIRNEIHTDYARQVPIIALVANTFGNKGFFHKAVFQGVLSKPIGIMDLDDTIRQWVRH